MSQSLSKSNLKSKVPGSLSKKIFNLESQNMAPGLQSIALFSEMVAHHAHGVVIEDIDGNQFIDFVAGIGVGSVGHTHPHYIKMMSDQLNRISYASFCTQNRQIFLNQLAQVLPNRIESIQMYSSGAEAVEASLRLAKSVTNKTDFVGFWGGFHGKTGGVLPLLGDQNFKKKLGPLMPGVYSIGPYANCYRCPLKLKHPDCGFACVDEFRKNIKTMTSQNLAGILVEPMQGTAGNVIPPKGFLNAVQEVSKEFNCLLIADEMITGFGRTGKMWGVDHDSITPDVMTLGKGIGGGFPMSAVASTTENMRAKPFGNPSGSSSSYGGNPLASAAGRACLEIIEEEQLVKNSQEMGHFILNLLQNFQEESSIVGDVRGKGLMIGIDLVVDKKSKIPLDNKWTRLLFHECLDQGLICMCYSSVIRINPPLIINKEEAEKATQILIHAIKKIEKIVRA